MDSTERCCICLGTATQNESIYLLDCGCTGSWFHKNCEIEWMSSLEDFDYNCPTCRRPAPLKTNYSFSFSSGPDQKYLWFVGILVCAEHIIVFEKPIVWIFPWQSMGMIALPLAIRSNKTLPFFLHHIVFHNTVNSFFAYLAYYDKNSYELFFEFCKSIGILQLIAVLLFSLFPCNYHVDLLMPYAISRQLKHRREITDTELVTKAPADTLEGNESAIYQRRGRRMSRGRGKSKR